MLGRCQSQSLVGVTGERGWGGRWDANQQAGGDVVVPKACCVMDIGPAMLRVCVLGKERQVKVQRYGGGGCCCGHIVANIGCRVSCGSDVKIKIDTDGGMREAG
jgi:hypothetical protein